MLLLTVRGMLTAELHHDEREEKKQKRKKKRVPKLPDDIVVIKNKDKDFGGWMETWDEPKNRSPGCIPHSFRLVCLGGTNRGKTCAMKNLFLQHQSTARKFQKLYIITCDARSVEWTSTLPIAFDLSEQMCNN